MEAKYPYLLFASMNIYILCNNETAPTKETQEIYIRILYTSCCLMHTEMRVQILLGEEKLNLGLTL